MNSSSKIYFFKLLLSQIEQLFVNYTQVSGHRLNPRNSYYRQTIILIPDIFISNKVLLIGDANVGKTSFLQRYTRNTFRQDYKGTVGVDFALKILHMSDQDTLVKLQLWDVAGKCTCVRLYYRKKICYIFDTTQIL